MVQPRPGPDAAELTRAIERRLALSPLVEVRTFWPVRGVTGKWSESRWASAATAGEVAAWAAGRSRERFNVYSSINVVTSQPPDVERGGRQMPGEACDTDVAGRAVIPIDVDYPREAESSATDEQRGEAHDLADRIHIDLMELGWGEAAEVRDTGNGAVLEYLCEPGIPAPLVKKLLHALGRRYARPVGDDKKPLPGPEVDTTVYNPSRVLRLAGSVNHKGIGFEKSAPAKYVPRACRVMATAADPLTITAAMVEEVIAVCPPPPSPPPPPPAGSPQQTAGGTDAVARCREYLKPVPGGVMGSYGSKPCMWAARVCRWGFGLSEADSWPLMREYSERCTPPWSDGEITHKLKQAGEQGSFDKPHGWLLNASRPQPEILIIGRPVGGTPGAGDARNQSPPPPPPSGPAADGPSAAGQPEAPPEQPKTPRVRFMPSDEFDDRDDTAVWLIEKVLVAGEPGVVAGPSKCMKTSLSLDLCISLASGTPFLGTWHVPKPVKVAFASAESGERTLKRNARVICKERGLVFRELRQQLNWELKVPLLSDLSYLHEWAKALEDIDADVFILDPFYLALGDVEASNMFAVGLLLRSVADVLAPSGRTVILNHHTNKTLQVGTPMELQHMSHAGLEQYVRQMMFLNRRTRYKRDGKHELFFNFGGSSGFSGEYFLDVDEGLLDEHFRGKKWEVKLTNAVQARTASVSDKAAQREAETAAENNRQRVSVLRAIQEIEAAGLPATENAIRVAAKMGQAVARRTIRTLVEAAEIELFETTAPGKPQGEVFDAYRRVEQPTPAPGGIFTEPLEHPPFGQETLPSDTLPSDQTAAQTADGSDEGAAVRTVPSGPPIGGQTDGRDGSADGTLPSAVRRRRKKKAGASSNPAKPAKKPSAKKPKAKDKGERTRATKPPDQSRRSGPPEGAES